MAYWDMARTASGGLMLPLSGDDRDLASGLPLRSSPSSLLLASGGAGRGLDSTGSNGGRAEALLNSLLGSADPSRNLIDEAALGAKSAADTAYGAMIRNLSRMGVNPNAPRFAGTMRKWAANRLATEAAARNEAARAGQGLAFQRRMSLWGALQGQDEAERNRQFQAGQADAGRNFTQMMANMNRRWDREDYGQRRNDFLADRTHSEGRTDAESSAYADTLDAYLREQEGVPPAVTPAPAPGLVVPAHTPANFPATEPREPLQLQGQLGGDFSGGGAPSLSGYMDAKNTRRTRRPSLAYA